MIFFSYLQLSKNMSIYFLGMSYCSASYISLFIISPKSEAILPALSLFITPTSCSQPSKNVSIYFLGVSYCSASYT